MPLKCLQTQRIDPARRTPKDRNQGARRYTPFVTLRSRKSGSYRAAMRVNSVGRKRTDNKEWERCRQSPSFDSRRAAPARWAYVGKGR